MILHIIPDFIYQMRRKTPCFSYGDIRRSLYRSCEAGIICDRGWHVEEKDGRLATVLGRSHMLIDIASIALLANQGQFSSFKELAQEGARELRSGRGVGY